MDLDPDSFADNILYCLADVGAEPVPLGPAHKSVGQRHVDAIAGLVTRQSRSVDVRLQRGVVDRAAEAECDLIISVVGALRPETVKRIKSWDQDRTLVSRRDLEHRAPADVRCHV